MTVLQILGAVVIGLPLGYVMQGPQVCYNRAYRRAAFQGDNTMLRALALAMLIQMVGFHVLVSVGVVKLNVVPGIWLAALVGGFLFGMSFVFAEGCSSTMWYRLGNGNLGSLIVLAGFAAGEVATSDGFIRPLREQLQRPQLLTTSGQPATLPNLLSVSPWIFVVPIALAGGWWLWRSARAENRAGGVARLGGQAWPLTGLALGVIGTGAWVLSQGTGWDYGIGVVGATGPVAKSLFQGSDVLSWGSFVVLSMPVGGLLAALQRGEFVLKVPSVPSGARYLLSGVAMGVTATLAGGCNVGHTFSGAPTLALSSLLASVAIFLGATSGNWLRYVQLKTPLPAIAPGE